MLGLTIFADALNRSATGQFLRVPLLTGINANEGDLLDVIEELITNTTIPEPEFDQLSEEVTNVRVLSFCLYDN